MPILREVSYSRDACVAAVRDYYSFLTTMYLEEWVVIEPPEGGWPSITTDNMQSIGKTDEVVALLRHLPYIREPNNDNDKAQGAPFCYFADWQSIGLSLSLGKESGEDARMTTESASIYEQVPPHVVSLTHGGRDNPVFLLDTELGIVHWFECPSEIRWNPSREQVLDNAYDWAPENEAEWRADGGTWAMADFFEILKDQFRELNYVPISFWSVVDVWTTFGIDTDGMVAMLQDIYREYGWPDLERYRKRECLQAVQTALEERYPQNTDFRMSI